jgi:hypothetical protein
VVEIAGSQIGGALRYALENLRHDPAVANIATSQNGTVLSRANEDLKKGREVVRISDEARSFAICVWGSQEGR